MITPHIDKSYKIKYKDIVVIKQISKDDFCVQEIDIIIINTFLKPKIKYRLHYFVDNQKLITIKSSTINYDTCIKVVRLLKESNISYLVLDSNDKSLLFERFKTDENNYNKVLKGSFVMQRNKTKESSNRANKLKHVDPLIVENNKSLKSENRIKTKNDIDKFNKAKDTLYEIYITDKGKEKLDRSSYTPRKFRLGVKKYKY